METSGIDLFVLARPGHQSWLRDTIESARRHLRPSPDRVVVVGQPDEPGLAETARRFKADFLDGPGLLGFAPGDIPVLKSWSADRREECFRQFLKWALSSAARGRAYLAMDAGSALLGEREVFDGRRYVLAREDLFHFPDCRMHNWLFGMYPPPGGWFAPPSMVYDKTIVAQMLALIETRYAKIHWYDAVLNILNQVPATRFCAAQAYGGYAQTFHAGMVQFRSCRHARAAGGSADSAEAEMVTRGSGDPPMAPALAKPILRMSTLGVNGRFGNQIFQYAFTRLFARRHGMEAQIPPWAGSALFGHQDRCGSEPLPLWREENGVLPPEMEELDKPKQSHELWGYFQCHTSFYRAHQAEFRAMFRPLDSIRVPLRQSVERLRSTGKTLVGIHLRRGDYAGGDFWPAPSHWYIQWLERIWPTLDQPVLYLASDEPAKIIGDFARFAPKTAADLGLKLNGAEFYADFFTLTQCDVLAISNSTFSYAAAMLNEKAQCLMRPDPDHQGLVPFDPWDSRVLLMPKLAA